MIPWRLRFIPIKEIGPLENGAFKEGRNVFRRVRWRIAPGALVLRRLLLAVDEGIFGKRSTLQSR